MPLLGKPHVPTSWLGVIGKPDGELATRGLTKNGCPLTPMLSGDHGLPQCDLPKVFINQLEIPLPTMD